MGLGDAALPRFYAVRLLQCNSPAFSLPIMPAGRRRSAPLPSVVLDRLDRPDAAIHPTAWKEGSTKLPRSVAEKSRAHRLSTLPSETNEEALAMLGRQSDPDDGDHPYLDLTYDGTPSTASSPCTAKSCSLTRTSPISTLSGQRAPQRPPEPACDGVALAILRGSVR